LKTPGLHSRAEKGTQAENALGDGDDASSSDEMNLDTWIKNQ
jgi:hypothetical protein